MQTTTAFVINEKNYDTETGTFRVRFQQPQDFHNAEIALAQASLYNSFPNVSSALANNQFSLFFPDGAGHKEFQFTAPEGYYGTANFLIWLKKQMDSLKLYTLEADLKTKNYHIALETNNSYQVMISHFIVPSTANLPASSPISVPTTYNQSPYFVFPLGLSRIFGYTFQQIGNGTGTQHIKSDTTPHPNIVSSVILECNLVNNGKITRPAQMLSVFATGNVGYGSLITIENPKLQYHKIANNRYEELVVSFRDQNLNILRSITDPNALILLSIKQKK